MDPDINVTERLGNGCLATIFSDPSDLPIIFRKWIFGDGVVLEGSGLDTVQHNYYSWGEYDVVLIARTATRQYTVTQEKLIVVNEIRPEPHFIITQSFNHVTGEYWRFYLDRNFILYFENNEYIVQSKEKVADVNRWTFLNFNMHTNTMYGGSTSRSMRLIESLRSVNENPLTLGEIRSQILPYGNMKIDELKFWKVEKDLYTYYNNTRGKSGYLDNQV